MDGRGKKLEHTSENRSHVKGKKKERKRYKRSPISSSDIRIKEKKKRRGKKKRHSLSSSEEGEKWEADLSTSSFDPPAKSKRSPSTSSEESGRKRWGKKRTRKKTISSSDSEWEEKNMNTTSSSAGPGASATRDNWMNIESLVPTVEKKKKVVEKKQTSAIIANPGQTERELNPYWKDGGSGLPSEEKDLHVSASSVGDKGLEWYKKAFKRAQETAKEENRSLEEVVSERWGSLETLKSLIMSAESKRDSKGYDRHYRSYERRNDYRNRDRGSREHGHHDKCDERPRGGFLKPGNETGRERVSDVFRSEGRRKWMRPDAKEKQPDSMQRDKVNDDSLVATPEDSQGRQIDNNEANTATSGSFCNKEENKGLSDDQINALAAKLVKAEILGNAALVEKLKAKLEKARSDREVEKQKGTSAAKEETVFLLQTNEKGLTMPVQGPSMREPTGGRRKKHNVTTHSGGQRQRYFADDDKRDLKSMFEREKLGTADDDKEMFLKLAARTRAGAGSDEEDNAFIDAARVEESEGKIQERERSKAIREENRRRKTMEGCTWCLDNKARLKHLVVSIGETCYICLPSEESLSPYHCLIVPILHTACGTILDEDGWEEIHKFRKALVEMATSKDKVVVLFEQAVGLRNNPHMVIECILMDRDTGDLAPIYFKKAILECESEWANNKKVVDMKGSDVRRSVPKGLPYFAVEFPPTSGGFAHVIEDEKYFPKNFAQEIIGGMLDLDHRKWRKRQKSNFAAQREKTLAFIKEWSSYDFTKKQKKSYSNSSSLSSSSSSNSD